MDIVRTSEGVEVEVFYLPPRWILAHYRSSEAETWEATRADFAANHSHLDALAADIADRGVLTPLQLDPAVARVRRGHHRLLLADEAGAPLVPVVFALLDETTLWDPVLRIDVPADDIEWDDEPWTDRVFDVPAAARAMALPAARR